MTDYIKKYLKEVEEISKKIDQDEIEKIIKRVADLKKENGRIFFIGVGGSAGNCSHAVNDFRKLAQIQCYSPVDNVSELTARINDEGWETVFSSWLERSFLTNKDLVFVLSVGGGNLEKNISVNILESLKLAKEVGAKVSGVVGRDGGYTAEVADECIVVPTVNEANITPHTEAFQAVVWHLLVAHPLLLANEMKWESVK